MTSSDDVRQAPGGTGRGPTSPEEIEPIGAEQRWRLVLGLDARGRRTPLSRQQAGMDQALRTLYDEEARSALQGRRARGGLGESSPRVARWLGDIRTYFPTRVVQVMQVDALERFGLTSMLLEPEVLEMVEPDIHLAATLASLSQAVPEQSKATARAVVADPQDPHPRRVRGGSLRPLRRHQRGRARRRRAGTRGRRIGARRRRATGRQGVAGHAVTSRQAR